jgi:hypothetical protein
LPLKDYKTLPEPPAEYTAPTIVIRLLDDIGYRYWRALEGVEEGALSFSPCDGAMTLLELQRHIFDIVEWVYQSVAKTPKKTDFSVEATFELMDRIKAVLLTKKDSDLENLTIRDKSFWYVVSGPLADALTHIGQINTYKRMAGCQVQKKGYFLGE